MGIGQTVPEMRVLHLELLGLAADSGGLQLSDRLAAVQNGVPGLDVLAAHNMGGHGQGAVGGGIQHHTAGAMVEQVKVGVRRLN